MCAVCLQFKTKRTGARQAPELIKSWRNSPSKLGAMRSSLLLLLPLLAVVHGGIAIGSPSAPAGGYESERQLKERIISNYGLNSIRPRIAEADLNAGAQCTGPPGPEDVVEHLIPPRAAAKGRSGCQQGALSLAALGGVGRRAEASAQVRMYYQKTAQRDLDKGTIWRIKTFKIFPVLIALRHFDHYSRVIYPLSYIIFVIFAVAEIPNFGRDHWALLCSSPCFREAVGGLSCPGYEDPLAG